MAGNLIVPRVEIMWGDINLSSYSGPELSQGNPEPLVYNVHVQAQSQSQGPTATMRWNPSAAAFKVYEKLIGTQLDKIITTRFFYENKKTITFRWVWSGQNFTYGNNSEIEIVLQSELAGNLNGPVRSVNSNYDKGTKYINHLEKLVNKYGADKKLITYEKTAKNKLEAAKLYNQYGKDITLGAALTNAMKQAGTYATPSNFGQDPAQLAVFTAYGATKGTEVQNAFDAAPGKDPERNLRYGYFLGPAIINTIQRSYTWTPPQQNKVNTPATQYLATSREKEKQAANKTPKPVTATQDGNAKSTDAVLSPSLAATNPGIRNQANPEGPALQQALQGEGTAKLSFETFMVPVVVGLKPNDIVFIPSFKGDYMEDWIVQSVSYESTDGGVRVGVQASRIYGTAQTMNQEAFDKFMKLARQYKLVGDGATLEAWDSYAWQVRA